MKEREKAAEFFMAILNADCDKIAVENPIGYMNSCYRKPDQIIQPYMFGDKVRKATCLWLKGLPNLTPTDIVEPEIYKLKNSNKTDSPWHRDTMNLPKEERSRIRSQTYQGTARAFADQWG